MKLIPAGGHVEIGERFEGTIVREMREETDVTVLNPSIIGVISFISEIDNSHNVCFMFKAFEYSGEPENREPEKVVPEWINTNDLLINKDIPSYYAKYLFMLKKIDKWEGGVIKEECRGFLGSTNALLFSYSGKAYLNSI